MTCKIYFTRGGSPGLVVMGGDSCSKGRGFESQYRILDEHFSHLFVVKIAMFVWRDENKHKRGRDGPFLLYDATFVPMLGKFYLGMKLSRLKIQFLILKRDHSLPLFSVFFKSKDTILNKWEKYWQQLSRAGLWTHKLLNVSILQ